MLEPKEEVQSTNNEIRSLVGGQSTYIDTHLELATEPLRKPLCDCNLRGYCSTSVLMAPYWIDRNKSKLTDSQFLPRIFITWHLRTAVCQSHVPSSMVYGFAANVITPVSAHQATH